MYTVYTCAREVQRLLDWSGLLLLLRRDFLRRRGPVPTRFKSSGQFLKYAYLKGLCSNFNVELLKAKRTTL